MQARVIQEVLRNNNIKKANSDTRLLVMNIIEHVWKFNEDDEFKNELENIIKAN